MDALQLTKHLEAWAIRAALALVLLCGSASGQVEALEKIAPATPTGSGQLNAGRKATQTTDDTQYRIGTGDVLDIRVFNRPMLSRDAVRVDGRGMIRLPLLDEVEAVCRTESELAAEVATKYLKYQTSPHVDVFIKEYNSQPVAVIGAVNQPGRFQLQRRVRLLELLSFAGGPSGTSGGTVNIIHTSAARACPAAMSDGAQQPAPVSAYNLNQTLQGGVDSNPLIQPGDIVSLPDAAQVYVVGNVFRPTSIPLKDQPVTLATAIAVAGGVLPDSKKSKVRLTRQQPGSAAKQEIIVDLEAITKRQADDIVLQANDIVEVPTSSGKRLLRSLLGTIAPAVSQLPVRVIP